MKSHAICDHCGAKKIEYTFSFNTGLATFLGKLYDVNAPAKTDTLGLTYSQRTNSQKLRYWGLAVPAMNEESKAKKGWWMITEKGKAFVRGEISIQKSAITYRNEVLRFEGEHIMFSDVSEGYKYHDYYANQVKEQLFLIP
jgi:hypothetical protein